MYHFSITQKIFSCIAILFLTFSCKKPIEKLEKPINKNVTSFTLSKLFDIALPQDIYCEIGQDTIFVNVFNGTDISNLTPFFTSENLEIAINGEVQTSGKSKVNFNKSIVYTAKASDGSIKTYTIKINDTKLPVAYITTKGGIDILSKTTYVNGFLTLFSGTKSDSLYNGAIEIRGRGNSTWNLPKKPFKIKLNKKASILNMKSSKNWVLLANHSDKSLLRNEVGFELSRRIGLAYTPASRMIEVVLNGLYIGNYELIEQVEVAKHKVNIPEQSVENIDISGGYFVEVDGFARNEPVYFSTTKNMPVSVHSPESEKITGLQKIYIVNHFNQFEKYLFMNNADSSYTNYFDLNSYVNYYIVNEIIGNPDLFWSTNMYKYPNNNVLFTGPVWDFDIAANNDSRLGDVVNKLMADVAFQPKQWIDQLYKDKRFRNLVKKRWNEIYANISMGNFIDNAAKQISISQAKNFQKWPILNQKVYLNFQVAGSWEAEVNYLKNHISNRINWLNGQFNGSKFD